MHSTSSQFNPEKMNQYLALGARARSDAFYAVYSSIKETVLNAFQKLANNATPVRSAQDAC